MSAAGIVVSVLAVLFLIGLAITLWIVMVVAPEREYQALGRDRGVRDDGR